MTAPPGAELVTMVDAARAYGVSRQAIEQALARSLKPPEPVMHVTAQGIALYDKQVLHDWWLSREANAWTEQRRPHRGPSRQVNIRIPQAQVEQVLAFQREGQTLAALTAEIFREGLSARLSRQNGSAS